MVSNLGAWMHTIGAQWLMTTISSSPAAVALLQTAGAIPVFLLSLHAGALADVVDRRRLLIFTQSWMLVSAAILALVDANGLATPALLLGLTAMLAVGSALNAPAWSSIVPEIVGRDQLPSALVINSMTFTAAMALGPALGGAVVAVFGTAAVFAINALTFLATIVVLVRWRRPPADTSLPAEHLTAAVRAGLRYLRHAPATWPVLARLALHVLAMSATMSLLPVLARSELGASATQFGLLFGAMGIGSAFGAFVIPAVRARLGIDVMVALAAATTGIGMVLLSRVDSLSLAALVLAANGLAAMATMSSFNLAMQRVLPSWVRGRGLALYTLVFQLAVALGAAGWGALAQSTSVRTTLLVSGSYMCATALVPALAARLRIGAAVDSDAATGRWPAPAIAMEPDPDDGPVLVTVDYDIDPEDLDAFLAAARRLRVIRRRDGALAWNIFRDLAEPRRVVESYVCTSWGEHLRLRARSTPADRDLWQAARSFHRAEQPPLARFHVAGRPGQRLRVAVHDEAPTPSSAAR